MDKVKTIMSFLFLISLGLFMLFFSGRALGKSDYLAFVGYGSAFVIVVLGTALFMGLVWNRKFGRLLARRVEGPGFSAYTYQYWYWSVMLFLLTCSFIFLLVRYDNDGRGLQKIICLAISIASLIWMVRGLILNPKNGNGKVSIGKGEIVLDFSERLSLVPGTMEIVQETSGIIPGFLVRGEWDMERKRIFGINKCYRERRGVMISAAFFGDSDPEFIKSILSGDTFTN